MKKMAVTIVTAFFVSGTLGVRIPFCGIRSTRMRVCRCGVRSLRKIGRISMLRAPRRLTPVLPCCLLVCASAVAADRQDDFDHLIEINKASLVMLVEDGLVSPALAARIAEGTLTIDAEQRAEGSRRSSNHLVLRLAPRSRPLLLSRTSAESLSSAWRPSKGAGPPFTGAIGRAGRPE
jgi:hypothetical protein